VFFLCFVQGRQQKIFQGGGGATEKRPKISKKIALFSLFQERGRGTTEKKTEK